MSYKVVPEVQRTDARASLDSLQIGIDGPSVAHFNDWHGGPRTLGRGRFESLAGWIWDVLLTLAPICFLVLAILANRLEGERISDYGDQIVDFTRLSPTIYPILFAAVAGRFFKNLARWSLERRKGIELGTLEQMFGSQSLAGAIERLLFVRTQLLFGILILLIWGLSPLGGQSAVRLLRVGEASDETTGSVYFANSRLRKSEFQSGSGMIDTMTEANNLYLASLMASPSLKGSAVDLWGLPKIPQWPKRLDNDVERQIGRQERADLAAEEEYYASFLGVQVQGLNFVPKGGQYDFNVEKLYYEIDCSSVERGLLVNESSAYFPDQTFDLPALFNTSNPDMGTFAVSMTVPNLTAKFPDFLDEPVPLRDIPSSKLLYATRHNSDIWSQFDLFDCSLGTVIVDTAFTCNTSALSTDCWATHQRRIDDQFSSNDTVFGVTYPYTLVERNNFLREWRIAERMKDSYKMSLTDQYLAGQGHTWSSFGGSDWPDVPLEALSKRLTTVFNTYWECTLDPLNHTNINFTRHPTADEIPGDFMDFFTMRFFNQTEGVATMRYEVYRADRLWVALLIITTTCLEILAVLGLVLEFLIHGPDILGFASSLTRENPYAGLSPGGSTLDGPERARLLKHLRVQLSDVQPGEEVGYIALKTPSYGDKSSGDSDQSPRSLGSQRLYG